MQRYRFYEIREDGEKFYLADDCESWTRRKEKAGSFSEQEWQDWGSDGLQREPTEEDEAMRRADAPMLPGMEI